MTKRHVYIGLGKYPGQIVESMITNVNLDGWDLDLDPRDNWNMQAGRQGGRRWYIDTLVWRPRQRQDVVLVAAAEKVSFADTAVVMVNGVPEDVPSVSILVKHAGGEEEVRLTRLASGALDHLELEWANPAVVTIDLHPRTVQLRTTPLLIYFEEPEA
jgi:hypothetical protein